MTSPFKIPYHFDNFKVDEEGDYSKIIGIFKGDWSEDIATARKIGTVPQRYNEQDYGHAANKKSEGHKEEDADNPNGQPEAVMFTKVNFDKHPGACPMFEKIVDFLKMDHTKKLTQKFNDQLPNNQLMIHIDNLPGMPRADRVLGNPDFKLQDPDKLRFLIMMEDWQPGQMVQFGNKIYSQWRAGTAITWEWSTLPHATWNGSWFNRGALQLTGSATPETWDIIRNGSADTIYNI